MQSLARTDGPIYLPKLSPSACGVPKFRFIVKPSRPAKKQIARGIRNPDEEFYALPVVSRVRDQAPSPVSS